MYTDQLANSPENLEKVRVNQWNISKEIEKTASEKAVKFTANVWIQNPSETGFLALTILQITYKTNFQYSEKLLELMEKALIQLFLDKKVFLCQQNSSLSKLEVCRFKKSDTSNFYGWKMDSF